MRVTPGVTILGCVMILWSIQSLFEDFYTHRNAYREEKARTERLVDSLKKEERVNNELQDKILDPIALKANRIRAENAEELYSALYDCTTDLNRCLLELNNSDSQHWGVMLQDLNKNRAHYEQILQKSAYPK